MKTFNQIKDENLNLLEWSIDDELSNKYAFGNDFIKIPLHNSLLECDEDTISKILSQIGYDKEYKVELLVEKYERKYSISNGTDYLDRGEEKFLKFTPLPK